MRNHPSVYRSGSRLQTYQAQPNRLFGKKSVENSSASESRALICPAFPALTGHQNPFSPQVEHGELLVYCSETSATGRI